MSRSMTIAISVKVNDGIVLCSDSALTLSNQGNIIKVHNNANKICNLFKGVPLGFMTWGSGAIGTASTATLAKDLRAKLMSSDPQWAVDPKSYSVKDIAEKADRFFRGAHQSEYGALPPPDQPFMGFVVCGYSTGASMPETWVDYLPTEPAPKIVQGLDDVGVAWWGEIEPITRLMFGHGTRVVETLVQLGLSEPDANVARQKMQIAMEVSFVQAPMPIQDAIDVSEFLALVAAQWARFKEGHATVGGPVEIAAITKHEGFKWIKRKHYYSKSLNPETDQ